MRVIPQGVIPVIADIVDRLSHPGAIAFINFHQFFPHPPGKFIPIFFHRRNPRQVFEKLRKRPACHYRRDWSCHQQSLVTVKSDLSFSVLGDRSGWGAIGFG
jgi:hypothetical protein